MEFILSFMFLSYVFFVMAFKLLKIWRQKLDEADREREAKLKKLPDGSKKWGEF